MDTTLSFGSECGDINVLYSIAKVLCEEPPEYLSILNHELTSGISYPKAREKISEFGEIIELPLNIYKLYAYCFNLVGSLITTTLIFIQLLLNLMSCFPK